MISFAFPTESLQQVTGEKNELAYQTGLQSFECFYVVTKEIEFILLSCRRNNLRKNCRILFEPNLRNKTWEEYLRKLWELFHLL